MPVHDRIVPRLAGRGRIRDNRLRVLASIALSRDGRRNGEPEGEPVEPRRPNLLSGGAAAELDFDS